MAKVKVSQATIDGIKKMGMTKALSGVKSSSGAEYKEAVRRMYGETRLQKALGGGYAAKPSATKPSTSGSKPGSKTTTAMDYSSKSKTQPKPRTIANAGGKVATGGTKSSGGFRLTPKEVVGGVAALGVLAATKGRGTAVAARLAPGLSKTGVGKAILGKTANAKSAASVMAKKTAALKEEAAAKALAKAGQATAKRGGAVTQAQYEAMQAAAKAKGIKFTSAEVAKKAATKAPKAKPPVKKAPPAKKAAPSKPPVKKSPVKKAATIGVGAGGAKGGKK